MSIPDALINHPHFKFQGEDEFGVFAAYDATEEELELLAAQAPGWKAVLNTIRPSDTIIGPRHG